MTVSSAIERQVVQRANGRCEYCRMHQSLQGATFHVEHIIPTSQTVDPNWATLQGLARAVICTSRIASMRRIPQRAKSHGYSIREVTVGPITLTGKTFATLGSHPSGVRRGSLLRWNTERRQKIRIAEKMFGLFPPNESWTG